MNYRFVLDLFIYIPLLTFQMRENTTSSKEELNSLSDHDRSFERTRGSFIACINRSLEHAFDFLSETGYASGGLSDAERVESRSEDELDRTQEPPSDFVKEINDGLRKCGVSEIKVANAGNRERYKPGQLWRVDNKPIESTGIRVQNGGANMSKAVREEKIDEVKGKNIGAAKKIIVYQHVSNGHEPVRQNLEKKLPPKYGTRNGDANHVRKQEHLCSNDDKRTVNGIGLNGDLRVPNGAPIVEYRVTSTKNDADKRSIDNGAILGHEATPNGVRCVEKEIRNIEQVTNKRTRSGNRRCKSMDNLSSSRKMVDKENLVYGSKVELRNRRLQNGLIGESDNGQLNLDGDRRETVPYLTTERDIFKQLLTNAKESAQSQDKLHKKHHRNHRSLSNLDLRRSGSKTNVAQSSRQKTPVKAPVSEHKGFQKFRESFRKKTRYFMPQKFAVQEEKENEGDVTNAIEFQYHRMSESRDNKEPITASKGHVSKRKGFLRNIFERSKHSKDSPRPKSFFKSTESINLRWQSKENLARRNDRPKSISMLVDKVKDRFENNEDVFTELKSNEDQSKQMRRNSVRGSRFFRRSESLRSIPSTSSNSDAVRRFSESPSEGTDSLRILKSSNNRPMSVHDLLFRVASIDQADGRFEYRDSNNLHKLLKNRYSCCSIGDNIFRAGLPRQHSLDLREHEEHHDSVFASSSPRKDDDITEWIRGLQFSSHQSQRSDSAGESRNGDEVSHVTDSEESQIDGIYDSNNYKKFFYETRIVDGQIQTYL